MHSIRKPPDVKKLALRPIEAARAMGISERTLWTITSPRGPLKCKRIGRLARYPVVFIEEYLRNVDGEEARDR